MGKIRTKRYSNKRKSRNNSNKRKSRKEKNYKKSRKNSTKRNLRKKKSKRLKSVKRGGAGTVAGPPEINAEPVAAGDGLDALVQALVQAGAVDDQELVRARAVDPRDYPPPQGPPGLAPAGGFRLLPQGGQVGEAARREEAMRAAARAGNVEVFRPQAAAPQPDDGGLRPMDVCDPNDDYKPDCVDNVIPWGK